MSFKNHHEYNIEDWCPTIFVGEEANIHSLFIRANYLSNSKERKSLVLGFKAAIESPYSQISFDSSLSRHCVGWIISKTTVPIISRMIEEYKNGVKISPLTQEETNLAKQAYLEAWLGDYLDYQHTYVVHKSILGFWAWHKYTGAIYAISKDCALEIKETDNWNMNEFLGYIPQRVDEELAEEIENWMS